MSKPTKKVVRLSRIEKALIALARRIERCPFNEIYVEKEILEILNLEEINHTTHK